MKHFSQQTLCWILGTGLVIVLGLYVGASMFVRRGMTTISEQAVELAREVRRQQSLQDGGALLEQLSDGMDALHRFFASSDDVVGFIERVESLGSDTGSALSIGEVHVEDATDEQEGTLVLNVSTEGSWKSVTHTLALLDMFPVVSSIDSVALTFVGDQETSKDMWNLRVGLRVPLRR